MHRGETRSGIPYAVLPKRKQAICLGKRAPHVFIRKTLCDIVNTGSLNVNTRRMRGPVFTEMKAQAQGILIERYVKCFGCSNEGEKEEIILFFLIGYTQNSDFLKTR